MHNPCELTPGPAVVLYGMLISQVIGDNSNQCSSGLASAVLLAGHAGLRRCMENHLPVKIL